MRVVSFLLLSVIASLAFAEGTGLPGVPPGTPSFNPNAIQAIDGKFFDPKKEEKLAPNPQTNGDGRYFGDDPNYNTEQRAQWLQTCEPLREKDPDAYKKCYADEKKKTLDGIKQTYDAVEKRQQEPLRNTNPLLDDQQRKSPNSDD